MQAVQIVFDPRRVSYDQLARLFFRIHDSTHLSGQRPYIKTHCCSVIFYHDELQKVGVETIVRELGGAEHCDRPIVAQLVPAGAFWPTEQ
jgi:peptide methionine sulfoxide reductase MsrA